MTSNEIRSQIAGLQKLLETVESDEARPVAMAEDARIESARARGIPDKHIAGTAEWDRIQRQTEAGLRFLLNEGLNPFDTLGSTERNLAKIKRRH